MVDSRKSLEDELLVLQESFSACEQSGDMAGMARARAKLKKTRGRLEQLTGNDATESDVTVASLSQASNVKAQPQPDVVVELEEVAAPQIHPSLSPAPAPAPAVKPSISPVASATPLSLLVTSEKETARAPEEITSLDVKASSQPIAPTAGNTNSSANATPEPSLASLLVSSLERTPVYQNDEPSNEDDSQQAYADRNYLALMGQKLTALTALDEKEREVQAQSLINELIELAQLERSAGVTAVSDSQSLRRVFKQFSESYSPEIEKADLGSEEISPLSSTEEVVRVWHEPPITPPQMELSAKKTDSKDQIISLSVKEQAAKVLVDLIAGKETLAQIARDEKRGSGDGVELSVPNGTDKDLKKEFGKFFKFLTSPQKFISAIEEEQKKSNE